MQCTITYLKQFLTAFEDTFVWPIPPSLQEVMDALEKRGVFNDEDYRIKKANLAQSVDAIAVRDSETPYKDAIRQCIQKAKVVTSNASFEDRLNGCVARFLGTFLI